MATITKKIWPAAFEAVRDGSKTFELRLNDFEIQPGDTLVLEEFDPKESKYTGRRVEKVAGYIKAYKQEELPFWPIEEIRKHGLQIISLLEKK